MSEASLAFIKLAAVFGVLALLLRLKVRLWLAVFAACGTAALSSGLGPAAWPDIALGVLTDSGFLLLCVMVFLLLLLSGVQDATGQSSRLVHGLERYMHTPRLRLVLFPALVGLLPMPGGALFSCPMIKAAAEGMGLSGRQKGLINYWFRHIWETAWPLYPGYALLSSLLGLPVTALCKYTFVLVGVAFASGWFFYMKDLAASTRLYANEAERSAAHLPGESLVSVLLNGLPIAVTLVGAAFFGFVCEAFFPGVPTQVSFCLSLVLAVATAVAQGGGLPARTLARMAFTPAIGRLFILLFAVYLFKDTIVASGIVETVGNMGAGPFAIVVLFVLLPFISGLLTGIMVGFVGLCFPILLGVLAHSSMQEYLLPLVVLGVAAGNVGQLLSPVHVCLVVTGEYFTTPFASLWKGLLRPVAVLALCSSVWAAVLALSGASFSL